MDRVDLHVHTAASDGADAPAAAAEKAAAAALRAVAVTDHDTVSGIPEARAAGERLGVEVVTGIEISTDYRDNNVHLLGYFFDPDAPALRRVLDWSGTERDERNRVIVERMAADGFDISLEALRSEYPGAALGRPHMAEHLVRKGLAPTVKEAFDLFLGVDGPYFLPRRRIPLAEAIELVRLAGGVSSLAHPLQYHYPLKEVEELIDFAVSAGVRALECYYSEHTAADQAWLLDMASRRGLGVSGGSDYHGVRKPRIAMGTGMGDLSIPYAVLEELRSLRPVTV